MNSKTFKNISILLLSGALLLFIISIGSNKFSLYQDYAASLGYVAAYTYWIGVGLGATFLFRTRDKKDKSWYRFLFFVIALTIINYFLQNIIIWNMYNWIKDF